MKITEVTDFPLITLPAGTSLYHGTDSEGDFGIPDGPAWFTQSADRARSWAGWSHSMPPGRRKAEKRVLMCTATIAIPLVDTRSEAVWRRFCDALMGDPEASMWGMAEAVNQAGYNGWYGNTEVLLVDPLGFLHPRGVVKV